jgi:putative OPT family oligopeptide transporter
MSSTEDGWPEITIKAVVLGVVLAVVLAGANAYLGLFAGMTVSASIPAAVVSMGVFRLFRRSNILENNLVQTAASAGGSLSAGVIFTLPAMVILGYWQEFNFLWVTVIAGFGGLLGVLFTIPLRRALIIESDLKFPEGVATAEVLISGQKGGSDIWYIVKASIVAGVVKLADSGLGLWHGTMEVAKGVGGSIVYFGSYLSPALLSVGYIVGLNIAVLIFLGGLCNWLLAIPIFAACNDWPQVDGAAIGPLQWAEQIWKNYTRYIGVGGMVVGGLWTIVQLRGSIFAGIKSGLDAYKTLSGKSVEIDRTEKDMPMKWVLALIVMSIVPLFILYQVFIGDVSVTIPMALIMLVMGFVFSAVAGYMAGLVGSSNNPISGVTIATVLFSALLLVALMGSGAENGPAAAIIIGAVVCCAAAIAGDNLQDLKAGHLVGATPWKQQVMQMFGTVAAALVMAPILTLLLKAYGFEGHESAKASPLIAVQANLMASVARGVFQGGLPWGYFCIGAVGAVGVIILDEILVRKGSSFRTPVLAVAIGFYLPFKLAVPIFAGGLINELIKRHKLKRHSVAATTEISNHHGLLFASGLITGEALMGIFMAIPIVISGRIDVLAVLPEPIGAWPGVIILAGIGYWLYRVGTTGVRGSKG